jgi:hypothetical protein
VRLWYSCASEIDEKGLGKLCEECDLRYQA